jgi:pyrroloquinoline-quinone synthase
MSKERQKTKRQKRAKSPFFILNFVFPSRRAGIRALSFEFESRPMEPWSTDEFTARLREVGRQKYHDRHPFHHLMNSGALSREQIQIWTANRFYYQMNIPIKDAVLLSRCPVREVRRKWVQRILDHDGFGDDPGGIEKWLRLGEGVGLSRDDLESDRLLLPATRFAVDAYVNFVATRPWIEGIASSLTELFAPELMSKRLAAFETHYTWIDRAALAYFRSRPPLAARDSEHGLALVHAYCRTREEQERAVAALSFKCDVLWAQLDAVYYHCVAK